MISNSVPWRKDLLRVAEQLRKRARQKRWTEHTYFLVERDVMLGAYGVRRLIESNKASSLLPQRKFQVKRHERTGRVPMHLDSYDLADFYDLDSPKETKIEVRTLCNQIIHSFIFQLLLDDNAVTSVALSSDFERARGLYVFTLDNLADLYDYVGREEIMHFKGKMIDGNQTFENVSNHDLVESGLARYGDESCTWVEQDVHVQPEEVLHNLLRQAKLIRPDVTVPENNTTP